MMQKRGFSALYNYSSPTNPRVFMTVAQGEKKLGEMVFELYADKQPNTVDNFRTICQGEGAASYVGSGFHYGLSEFGIAGGKIDAENVGADGTRQSDEDLTLRHHKRGLLTACTDGLNASGSQFMITFGETPTLNGYQTVFGELVSGEKVLDALEQGVNRHGEVTEDFTITATGEK